MILKWDIWGLLEVVLDRAVLSLRGGLEVVSLAHADHCFLTSESGCQFACLPAYFNQHHIIALSFGLIYHLGSIVVYYMEMSHHMQLFMISTLQSYSSN